MYLYKLQRPNTFTISSIVKRFSHNSQSMERSYAVRHQYVWTDSMANKFLGCYQCAEHSSIEFLRRRGYPEVERGIEQRFNTGNA